MGLVLMDRIFFAFINWFDLNMKIFTRVCVLVIQLFLILCNPHGLQSARLLSSWNIQGKNTGVGSHSSLQGLNPGCPALQADSYYLSHQGSPSKG